MWAVVFHGSPMLNRNFLLGLKVCALAGLGIAAGAVIRKAGVQGGIGVLGLYSFLVGKFQKAIRGGVFHLSEDEEFIGGQRTINSNAYEIAALVVTILGVGAFTFAGYCLGSSIRLNATVISFAFGGLLLFFLVITLVTRGFKRKSYKR